MSDSQISIHVRSGDTQMQKGGRVNLCVPCKDHKEPITSVSIYTKYSTTPVNASRLIHEALKP